MTFWCVAIVLISPVAIGVPVRWLIGGCRPFSDCGWVQVPFLGIATIILVLQNLVYLDVIIGKATPWIWLGTLLLWTWIFLRGQLGLTMRQCPRSLISTALFVYLVQGLALLIVGARHYIGRGWWDQINYTALAQFFTDDCFSTAAHEIDGRAYLINAVGINNLKYERIGTSILQGLFAASSVSNAKSLFEPTSLLSPALVVLAIYALCCKLGLAKGHALATGATAGLLPSVTLVHLESFQAQALAIPFLLYFPVVLDELGERPAWGRLAISVILFVATISIYVEFWLILTGVLLLIVGVCAFHHSHPRRLSGCLEPIRITAGALDFWPPKGVIRIGS